MNMLLSVNRCGVQVCIEVGYSSRCRYTYSANLCSLLVHQCFHCYFTCSELCRNACAAVNIVANCNNFGCCCLFNISKMSVAYARKCEILMRNLTRSQRKIKSLCSNCYSMIQHFREKQLTSTFSCRARNTRWMVDVREYRICVCVWERSTWTNNILSV